LYEKTRPTTRTALRYRRMGRLLIGMAVGVRRCCTDYATGVTAQIYRLLFRRKEIVITLITRRVISGKKNRGGMGYLRPISLHMR
jgi:hypothetical protein